MENENKEKKRQIHYDRVTVTKIALERLNSWVSQVHAEGKGVFVNRNDLVKWLIESHEEHLSASDLNEIEQMFYDEAKFANWAMKEFRQAIARGEKVTLADIIKGQATGRPSPGPRKRRKRKQISSEATSTGPEIAPDRDD